MEQSHAADAEQDLLANPRLHVPAVEGQGDFAQRGRVSGNVGVQEVDGVSAHLHVPDLGVRRPSG